MTYILQKNTSSMANIAILYVNVYITFVLSEDGSDINEEGVKNMINESVIIEDEVLHICNV